MANSEKKKAKNRIYQNEYRKKWPDKVRASQRLIKYGITQKDFDSLLLKQSNRCAICLDLINQSAAVDHDHRTNQIRGLLCNACNLGIAWFKDDIMILQNAIRYLGKV